MQFLSFKKKRLTERRSFSSYLRVSILLIFKYNDVKINICTNIIANTVFEIILSKNNILSKLFNITQYCMKCPLKITSKKNRFYLIISYDIQKNY